MRSDANHSPQEGKAPRVPPDANHSITATGPLLTPFLPHQIPTHPRPSQRPPPENLPDFTLHPFAPQAAFFPLGALTVSPCVPALIILYHSCSSVHFCFCSPPFKTDSPLRDGASSRRGPGFERSQKGKAPIWEFSFLKWDDVNFCRKFIFRVAAKAENFV